MADEKDIIKAIKEDQEKGFRMLMTEYMEPVYWHIRRLVVSHADAQDAAQEAFLRIFRSISQYSGNTSFKAWIFRIATNEALRLLSKNQGKAMISLDEDTANVFSLKADEYFDYNDVEAVKLQKAIHALPAKQQLAFNMRYYDDMSYEEIATVTDSTAANVKANYHLAKERIVKFMNSND